jgi:hypothetical protein
MLWVVNWGTERAGVGLADNEYFWKSTCTETRGHAEDECWLESVEMGRWYVCVREVSWLVVCKGRRIEVALRLNEACVCGWLVVGCGLMA